MYIAFLFFILTADSNDCSKLYNQVFFYFFYFKSPKLFNQLKNKKIKNKNKIFISGTYLTSFVALIKVAKFFVDQTVSYAVKIMNKNFWCGDPH